MFLFFWKKVWQITVNNVTNIYIITENFCKSLQFWMDFAEDSKLKENNATLAFVVRIKIF